MSKTIELTEMFQKEDFDELYRQEKHPRVKYATWRCRC